MSIVSKLNTYRYHKVHLPKNFKKVLADRLGMVGHTPDKDQTLKNTFQWIKASFEATGDGGSSAYYRMGRGWQNSYPETTGYLIPTLYDYGKYTGDTSWNDLAKKATDWLLSIQAEEGGWQGLQVGMKCDLRVFNTAMILDGLIAAYENEKDQKYFDAALKGAQWILQQQDANGLFTQYNVSGGGTFDTLTIACLLMVGQYLTGQEQHDFYAACKKGLDKIADWQKENGWWEKCDFDTGFAGSALLHHLGYTTDGLIISSQILGEEKYYQLAKKTARKLLSKFEVSLMLPAYSKSDWNNLTDLGGGKSSQCLTGYSQMAIVFQKIAQQENDLRYLNAALKINEIVAAIGNRRVGDAGIDYGLSGSYPVDGAYQPFQFVNWAAKYHAESVLLSLNACASKKKS